MIKKINNTKEKINVSIEDTKLKLMNRGGKITKIKADSSISKKETSLKLENIEESVSINIKLESTRELKNKIKEIEKIQKLNSHKINLTQSTVFHSDSELSAFIQSLEKVISKVRNLKWIIEGKLKDNGSGQFIGQVLKKCKGLYSLHLELVFPFLDSSVSELASSLQKIKDLKILKLWIIDPYLFSRTHNHYFTYMGNYKIIDSIKQLKHLQILEYNNYSYYELRFLDYFNITYVVKAEYCFCNPRGIFERSKNINYLEEQLQRGQYKTTSLNITDNFFYLTFRCINQGFDQCFEMDEDRIENIQKFYEILLGMIDLVFALPYLTSFRVSYFGLNSSNSFPEIYPDEKLTKKELITKQLIQERFLTVSSYLILVKYVYTEIPLNPHLLFSDLYFN